MSKATKIGCIILLFLMLIAVRAFVQPYLYDPLIEFFKSDYLYSAIPEINLGQLFLNIFYRYTLNTIISLTIIYLVYNNLKVFWFSVKLYAIAFILLCITLFVLLKFNNNEGYRLIFYVRRFLIHPIFLLILLPAFYYQKLKVKDK
tara:strand:+ start:8685 stop:9122 length:438 start_codon:yes stop_codon:yes gene_type:complete